MRYIIILVVLLNQTSDPISYKQLLYDQRGALSKMFKVSVLALVFVLVSVSALMMVLVSA